MKYKWNRYDKLHVVYIYIYITFTDGSIGKSIDLDVLGEFEHLVLFTPCNERDVLLLDGSKSKREKVDKRHRSCWMIIDVDFRP